MFGLSEIASTPAAYLMTNTTHQPLSQPTFMPVIAIPVLSPHNPISWLITQLTTADNQPTTTTMAQHSTARINY